jgi:hypothetical protein
MRLAPALVLAAVAALAACDSDDGWDPDAPFAPSLRPVVGVRFTDDDLRIWTGTPCAGVTRVAVRFDSGTDESTRWELTARRPGGVDLELLRLDGPNPGFRVTEALPTGFDWRQAEQVSFTADGPDVVWGTDTDLAVVRDGSSDHDEDTYYFDHIGWLDAAGVADGNGEDFITTCTPDPEDG